jgi:oligosaccharide amylase
MSVYLPNAILGNTSTLLTFGPSGEIMGWFWPSKDGAQHVHECLPCVYFGDAGQGRLSWTWSDDWRREQRYQGDCNICLTTLTTHAGDFQLSFTDVLADGEATLVRRIEARNDSAHHAGGMVMLFGDWNMGGHRMGNGVVFSRGSHLLCQSHRMASLAIGGDGLQSWQCGKAGTNWSNNARYAVEHGHLQQQDLEIGDVNWAIGFRFDLAPGESLRKHWVFAMAAHGREALQSARDAQCKSFDEYCRLRHEADATWLAPGLAALQAAQQNNPKLETRNPQLFAAYKRSLLALPLLCGDANQGEGVAIAAPEFDPEFIACGGYGYFWPRDGAEYAAGLMDAGYPQFADQLFDWCARHQDESGLWHQRYFLNGALAPNWCLPPDMLQIDQVGAVLWAYGKSCGFGVSGFELSNSKLETQNSKLENMIRRAAEYLCSRLTEQGVHGNAFDTWETFVGSFTYSNASIYAALCVASEVLGEEKFAEAAQRVKSGVLRHFVRDAGDYKYLVRGFDARGRDDNVVDSSSLGAIEPFGLLDLNDDDDLALAEGTLRAITERLECDWEGGRAIRRFEGDAYVGGVPACVNTLWMARCCLKISQRLRALNRVEDARALTERAELYLETVLRRATPTGLLPELMQGPEGQRWWAAPHGWAMASFVSGVLALAREQAALEEAPGT